VVHVSVLASEDLRDMVKREKRHTVYSHCCLGDDWLQAHRLLTGVRVPLLPPSISITTHRAKFDKLQAGVTGMLPHA